MPLRRPSRKGEDSIKTDSRRYDEGGIDGFIWLRVETSVWLL
jgi:hypothetical protein